MNALHVLCKSGLTIARLLAIAICVVSAGMIFDLPSLNATGAVAKDGADDNASHSGSDGHGGNDHGADNSGKGNNNDLTEISRSGSGSVSGSACEDTSVSLDLYYSDGFQEHVSDCTYVLTDRHGRVVITRSATHRDMERLETLEP